MNRITGVMMSLLTGQVCGGEPPLPALTADEAAHLYALSKTYDLAHLAGSALLHRGLLPDGSLRAAFEKQVLLAVYRCETQGSDLAQLDALLTHGQIPFLPLKGSVLRQYYPQPWMRTSCDIDVLVHPADLDRAVALLCENGFTIGEKSTHDVALTAPAGSHIELHYDLIEDGMVNDAAAVLRRVWDTAVPHGDSTLRYDMPDDLFYFYHMAHMAKHFVSTGGCGIRPLLDVWVLTHRIPFDRRSRDRLLAEGGLSAFAQQAELLSEVWFGGAAPTAVTDQMTSYILRGGLYGSMENRITVQQQKQGGKLRYAASRIFLPYDTLKHHYPVLEQHRWLTPPDGGAPLGEAGVLRRPEALRAGAALQQRHAAAAGVGNPVPPVRSEPVTETKRTRDHPYRAFTSPFSLPSAIFSSNITLCCRYSMATM